MAQASKEISRRLEVGEETADQAVRMESYVYGLMATQGLCPYPGDQPVHVIPQALEFVRIRAATPPEA